MNPARMLIAFLCLVYLPNDLSGQSEGGADTVSRAYEIHVIEVRADRDQLPYPVSRIPTADIQVNPAITMEPLLESVPGIWMQSGAPNTNRISIRGVGNRQPFATSKLKVYLGEIPLTNGVGESSIEDIDPMLYNGIEVWKSPSSALWGSGLGGMIHLSPAWEGPSGPRVSTTIGSFGLLNLRLLHRIRYDSAGMHQTVVHTQRAFQDGYRNNNQYQRLGLTLMHNSRINRKVDLHFFGHLIRLEAGIPSSLTLTDFLLNPEMAASNWQAVRGGEEYVKGIGGLHGRYLISPDWTYNISVFGQTNPAYEVRPFNILDSQYRMAGTRQRISFAPDPASLITGGLEFSGERYAWQTYEVLEKGNQGPLLNDQVEKRTQIYVFLHYETEILPGLRSVLGASFARTDQRLEGKKFSQQSFNPTLGLDYVLSPSGISLFTSLSRGFSPIALSDALASDGTLKTALNPEKGWSLEVGARYRSPEDKFRIQLAAYRMRISDLFVQKRITEDQFIGANAGRTIHDGIEVEGTWRFANTLRVDFAYSYADHRFGDFVDGNADYSGNALTGSAPHMLRNTLSWTFLKTSRIALAHRYISRVPINDANTVYGDAFHRFDLRFDTRLPFFGKPSGLHVSAGLNNVFDVRYASMFQVNAVAFGNAEPRYYYPGLPRHWFFRIGYGIE